MFSEIQVMSTYLLTGRICNRVKKLLEESFFYLLISYYTPKLFYNAEFKSNTTVLRPKIQTIQQSMVFQGTLWRR